MSSTSSKVGLTLMIAVAVFAGVTLAQKAKHEDYVPDQGCTMVEFMEQQACPLPSASITLSPSPSPSIASVKKDIAPDTSETDAPVPTPTRASVSEVTADPDNPTIAVQHGGGGGVQPTRTTNPMPRVTP